MGYAETYAAMSDDAILNVASDCDSLKDEARIAITVELGRRKLSEADVRQHRECVASF